MAHQLLSCSASVLLTKFAVFFDRTCVVANTFHIELTPYQAFCLIFQYPTQMLFIALLISCVKIHLTIIDIVCHFKICGNDEIEHGYVNA